MKNNDITGLRDPVHLLELKNASALSPRAREREKYKLWIPPDSNPYTVRNVKFCTRRAQKLFNSTFGRVQFACFRISDPTDPTCTVYDDATDSLIKEIESDFQALFTKMNTMRTNLLQFAEGSSESDSGTFMEKSVRCYTPQAAMYLDLLTRFDTLATAAIRIHEERQAREILRDAANRVKTLSTKIETIKNGLMKVRASRRCLQNASGLPIFVKATDHRRQRN